MLPFMNLKLPDDWQISDKQYYIFQKIKSFKISNTDICIGEDLEYIIYVFYRCIQLDHEINIKCKKNLTWLKLHLVIITALELKVNKQEKTHLSCSTKNV